MRLCSSDSNLEARVLAKIVWNFVDKSMFRRTKNVREKFLKFPERFFFLFLLVVTFHFLLIMSAALRLELQCNMYEIP